MSKPEGPGERKGSKPQIPQTRKRSRDRPPRVTRATAVAPGPGLGSLNLIPTRRERGARLPRDTGSRRGGKEGTKRRRRRPGPDAGSGRPLGPRPGAVSGNQGCRDPGIARRSLKSLPPSPALAPDRGSCWVAPSVTGGCQWAGVLRPTASWERQESGGGRNSLVNSRNS